MNPLKNKKMRNPSNLHDKPMHSHPVSYEHSGHISVSSEEESDSRDLPTKENEDIIKVYIRVKPDSKTASDLGNHPIPENFIKFPNNNSIHIINSTREEVKTLHFEHIFSEKYKQEEIFMVAGAPLIKHAITGYNSTIFVYGQTGTGMLSRFYKILAFIR